MVKQILDVISVVIICIACFSSGSALCSAIDEDASIGILGAMIITSMIYWLLRQII